MLFMLCGGIFRRVGGPELLVTSPDHRSHLRLFLDALNHLGACLDDFSDPEEDCRNSYEIHFLHLLPHPPLHMPIYVCVKCSPLTYPAFPPSRANEANNNEAKTSPRSQRYF